MEKSNLRSLYNSKPEQNKTKRAEKAVRTQQAGANEVFVLDMEIKL